MSMRETNFRMTSSARCVNTAQSILSRLNNAISPGNIFSGALLLSKTFLKTQLTQRDYCDSLDLGAGLLQ